MKLQTKQLSNQQVKDLFPKWTHEKQDRDLIMTHDLDSVLACTILHYQDGYNINAYASFNEGISLIDTVNTKKLIGVDFAMSGEKLCWDNHVTGFDSNSHFNPNSANLNITYKQHAASGWHYSQKMAFSTSLQVWAFYNLELPKTDEGKMLLLSIDSAYKGYYPEKYRHIWVKWMERLGLHELVDFCARHTIADFEKFRSQYKEGLKFENGYIHYDKASREFVEETLGFKLYIPEEKFHDFYCLEAKGAQISAIGDISRQKDVLSYAITSANHVQYSIYKGAFVNDKQ